MSEINTELDILKKNIRELASVSNNAKPNSVICMKCTYINESLGKNDNCQRCTLKLDSYLINRLEIKRLKGIINYFILDDNYKNFTIANAIDFYKPDICKEESLKKKSPCVIIMRHGIREDSNINGKQVVDESLNFYDKKDRQYDPPLLDYDIPKLRAKQLNNKYNITKIVSSPFRRCLQTAGIIAKVLKIPKVNINPLFGEKCTELRNLNIKFNTDIHIINEALNPPTVFNKNISVEEIIKKYDDGCKGLANYAYGDKDESLEELIESELANFNCDSNECLLIITHGDNVSNQRYFRGSSKFISNSVECGYISFEINKDQIDIEGSKISVNKIGTKIEINGGLKTMESL